MANNNHLLTNEKLEAANCRVIFQVMADIDPLLTNEKLDAAHCGVIFQVMADNDLSIGHYLISYQRFITRSSFE